MTDRFFGIILIILLASTAALAFLNSSYFDVKTVTVKGNSFFTTDDIVAMAGLDKPVNIFRLDERRCGASLERSSKISHVVIKKHLPSSVEILVTEREGVGLVPFNGTFCEVDAKGVVITEVKDLDRVQLPVLTGVELTYVAVGERVQPESALRGIAIAAQLPADVSSRLAELNIGDPSNLVGYALDGAKIIFGSSESLSEKAMALQMVLDQAAASGRRLRTIDVTIPNLSMAN